MSKMHSFSIEPNFDKAEIVITVVEGEEKFVQVSIMDNKPVMVNDGTTPVRTWVAYIPMRVLQ